MNDPNITNITTTPERKREYVKRWLEHTLHAKVNFSDNSGEQTPSSSHRDERQASALSIQSYENNLEARIPTSSPLIGGKRRALSPIIGGRRKSLKKLKVAKKSKAENVKKSKHSDLVLQTAESSKTASTSKINC